MTHDTETSQNDGGISNDVLPRRRNRSLVQMVKSRHIESSINRSQGQLNSRARFGGNKLGSHKKKSRAKENALKRDIPGSKPPERATTLPGHDDKQPPSENVALYLDHIRSVKENTYSKFINLAWINPKLSQKGRAIINSLPSTPTYELRLLNRIFCHDSWQNIPKSDRKILFSTCLDCDFRSLHFEIFMMLLRKHNLESAVKITSVLGGASVWDWFDHHGIRKADAKLPIQTLINSKSAINTIQLLSEPERLKFKDFVAPTDFSPNRFNAITPPVEDLVKEIETGRKQLGEIVKTKTILDAFGMPLPHETPKEHYYRTGEWKQGWRLISTDLNALYSSYELKLMTDTIVPVLRAYERTKVVLHLHDGIYIHADNKDAARVEAKLKRQSDTTLESLGIRSKLLV